MRAHWYRGRENGLMLIASPEELQSLAGRLAAGPSLSGASQAWPPLVAEWALSSGSKDNFKVSIHLEGSSGQPPSNARSGPGEVYLYAAMAVLAAIGVCTLAYLILRAF